ncbi:sigma factor-like helix-turn-helix DNA-binding protein [Singulisphaera sp. PoT]|uniref:sigma factor-like helix-turn-helix DNA-binding protein n=1 Tax=Singulisphaera sp. PoT TaxID=3411797 RepID=UPI003BF5FD6C
MPPTPSTEDQDRTRLKESLHAEIDRLPGRLRIPLVLCDLEGLGLDEAARACGVDEIATLDSLQEGRARLRRALARRGFRLAPGSLLTLIRREAKASVPEDLIVATTQAAVALVSGEAGRKGDLISKRASSTRAGRMRTSTDSGGL